MVHNPKDADRAPKARGSIEDMLPDVYVSPSISPQTKVRLEKAMRSGNAIETARAAEEAGLPLDAVLGPDVAEGFQPDDVLPPESSPYVPDALPVRLTTPRPAPQSQTIETKVAHKPDFLPPVPATLKNLSEHPNYSDYVMAASQCASYEALEKSMAGVSGIELARARTEHTKNLNNFLTLAEKYTSPLPDKERKVEWARVNHMMRGLLRTYFLEYFALTARPERPRAVLIGERNLSAEQTHELFSLVYSNALEHKRVYAEMIEKAKEKR